MFQLFDFYGASGMCLLWYCFFQAVVVGWFYSKFIEREAPNFLSLNCSKLVLSLASERFYANIEEMIGYRISPVFNFAWKYVSPLTTGGLFTFYVATHKSLKFNAYEYPTWAIVFGWSLAIVSMVMLPISMLYAWLKAPKHLTFAEVIFFVALFSLVTYISFLLNRN